MCFGCVGVSIRRIWGLIYSELCCICAKKQVSFESSLMRYNAFFLKLKRLFIELYG